MSAAFHAGTPGAEFQPDGATTYASVTDLPSAMRRASVADGEHETRIRKADTNWPEWYASYMVAEQAGAELPL